MAQFGRILETITGGLFDNSPKITEETKQYWEKVKKYKEIIKKLEKAGISRDKLRKAGLIIDYLLEDKVQVGLMGGGKGGGPGGIFPVFVPGGQIHNNPEAVNVSEPEINDMNARLNMLIRLNAHLNPEDIRNIEAMIEELARPEPTNPEERRQRRIIMRGNIDQIERLRQERQNEEVNRIMQEDFRQEEEERQRRQEEREVGEEREFKRRQLDEELERERSEVEGVYEEVESERNILRRELIDSYMRAFNENYRLRQELREYSEVDRGNVLVRNADASNVENILGNEDDEEIDIKIMKKIKDLNQQNKDIDMKIKENRRKKLKKPSVVIRSTSDIPKQIREELENKLLRPSPQQRIGLEEGRYAGKSKGIKVEEATKKIKENIAKIGGPKQLDKDILERVKLIKLKIDEGKYNYKLNKINIIATKTQPKYGPLTNRINKSFLQKLLESLASQENNYALYINYGQNDPRTGRSYTAAGLSDTRRNVIRDLLEDNSNNTTAQEILDIFSYYNIPLFNVNANKAGYKKIKEFITNLKESDRLDLYNAIAHILQRNGINKKSNNAFRVVLRNSLDERTERQLMMETIDLGKEIVNQMQDDLLFTDEEINRLAQGFDSLGLNRYFVEKLRNMNNAAARSLLSAQESADYGQLYEMTGKIREALIEELETMFSSIENDINKPSFNKNEFYKLIWSIVQNKKRLKKAGKISIENVLQIPEAIRSIVSPPPSSYEDMPPLMPVEDVSGQADNALSMYNTATRYDPNLRLLRRWGIRITPEIYERFRGEANEIGNEITRNVTHGQLFSAGGVAAGTRGTPMRRRGERGSGPNAGGGPVVPPAGGPVVPPVGGPVVPPGGGGGAPPPGPPGGPGNNLMNLIPIWFRAGGFRRNISLGGLILLLSSLGYSYKAIRWIYDNIIKGEEVDIPVDPPNGTGKGDEGEEDDEEPPSIDEKPKPIYDDDRIKNIYDNYNNSEEMDNITNTTNTTNTSNISGNYHRYAEPSREGRKPSKIKIPPYDRVVGAEEIEITPEIERNSVLKEKVEKYNEIAHSYNISIDDDEKEDIMKYERELVAAGKDIEYAELNDYIREEKFRSLEVTKTVYRSTPSGIVYTFNEVPLTPYYESLGLTDEINEINKNVREYNAKVRSGLITGKDLRDNYNRIIQLEYNTRFITQNPQYARQLYRPRLLAKEYPKDVRNVMNTALSSEEIKRIDYSEVSFKNFPKVEKALFDYNNAIDKLQKNPKDPEARRELAEAKQRLYNMAKEHAYSANLPEVYDPKVYKEQYEKLLMAEQAGAGARDETMLYGLIGHHLEEARKPSDSVFNNYYKSRSDYLLANKTFNDAVANGSVDRDTIESMYGDLETKRLKFKEDERIYRIEADRYTTELEERGTYLTDDDMEVLPGADAEAKFKFKRLQNIERMIQGNQDAVIEYNANVGKIAKNQPPKDIYDKRMALLKEISSKYGLESQYDDAYNENLDAAPVPFDADELKSKLPQNTAPYGEKLDGHDRARIIDPSEKDLFLLSKQQEFIEQQRFEEFSKVMPNHGLGSTNRRDRGYYNPLLVNQSRDYYKRFANADKKPKITLDESRINLAYQEGFPEQSVKPDIYAQPIYEDPRISSFGKVYYDDYEVNPYIDKDGKIHYTDEKVRSNKWYQWENNKSAFFPEFALLNKRQHTGVNIGEASRPPGYEYLDKRSYFGTTVNANDCIEAQDAGITKKSVGDNNTIRNDNLFDRRYSVYSGLSKYSYSNK
jgi:hypothetical protein